jgi:hypothetical protein
LRVRQDKERREIGVGNGSSTLARPIIPEVIYGAGEIPDEGGIVGGAGVSFKLPQTAPTTEVSAERESGCIRNGAEVVNEKADGHVCEGNILVEEVDEEERSRPQKQEGGGQLLDER